MNACEASGSATRANGWQPAHLLAPEEGYAWRFWEFHWTPPTPGRYTLLCRAIDAQGQCQPATQQADRESYLANWTVPIEIKVVAERQTDADEFMIGEPQRRNDTFPGEGRANIIRDAKALPITKTSPDFRERFL